jgi:excisionase family DNA binding protein
MLNTVKEAAKKLSISQSLVYLLLQRGALGCHKIGTGRGVYRISDTQIEVYLEGSRQDAGQRQSRAAGDLRPRHGRTSA